MAVVDFESGRIEKRSARLDIGKNSILSRLNVSALALRAQGTCNDENAVRPLDSVRSAEQTLPSSDGVRKPCGAASATTMPILMPIPRTTIGERGPVRLVLHSSIP